MKQPHLSLQTLCRGLSSAVLEKLRAPRVLAALPLAKPEPQIAQGMLGSLDLPRQLLLEYGLD
jgi:hypothetical protein